MFALNAYYSRIYFTPTCKSCCSQLVIFGKTFSPVVLICTTNVCRFWQNNQSSASKERRPRPKLSFLYDRHNQCKTTIGTTRTNGNRNDNVDHFNTNIPSRQEQRNNHVLIIAHWMGKPKQLYVRKGHETRRNRRHEIHRQESFEFFHGNQQCRFQCLFGCHLGNLPK